MGCVRLIEDDVNKRILFVVNVDWFFVSHRLPIALAAIADGYEVHLACSITDKLDYLKSLSITVHEVNFSRGGLALINELKTMFLIKKLLDKVKPKIVHSVTIKPVVYVGLLTRFNSKISKVSSISGLGYVFIANGLKAYFLKYVVISLYRIIFSGKSHVIIFQNSHDYNILFDAHVFDMRNGVIIRGSGVDLKDYPYLPEPAFPKKIIMASRLLYDKGVSEYVEAAKILKQRGFKVDFLLVGAVDKENPNGILDKDFKSWSNEGFVSVLGYRRDIAKLIQESSIAVLPSYYGEGLPKFLIEAAACGRAVITTDHPGCRDAIEPNKTGLLIPVKNEYALADAISYLLENNSVRMNFGVSGRALAEKEYGIEKVVEKHIKIYSNYLNLSD